MTLRVFSSSHRSFTSISSALTHDSVIIGFSISTNKLHSISNLSILFRNVRSVCVRPSRTSLIFKTKSLKFGSSSYRCIHFRLEIAFWQFKNSRFEFFHIPSRAKFQRFHNPASNLSRHCCAAFWAVNQQWPFELNFIEYRYGLFRDIQR